MTPLRVTFSLILCIASVGCVSFYVEPIAGPRAYVKFTDDTGPSITGGRKTGVHFYEGADCSKRSRFESNGWITVPANVPLGFNQFYILAGNVQGTCQVQAQMTLAEGQRAEVYYSFKMEGLRMKCRLQARELSPSGEVLGSIPLGELKGEQCKLGF